MFKILKNASIEDEELHDRFTAIVEKSFKREEQRASMLAHLDLLHPTRSDASGMIQLLRSDGPFVQQLFRPETCFAGLSVIFFNCRLARRCMADGRRSDATWVLDHVYDQVPYLLSGGSGLRSFKAKMQGAKANFRKRPSKSELKRADLVLDNDGILAHRDIVLRKHKKRPLFSEPDISSLVC